MERPVRKGKSRLFRVCRLRLEASGDFGYDLVREFYIGFGGLERAHLEADCLAAVHPRLGQIKATIVIDGVHQGKIVRICILPCGRRMTEGEQGKHRLGNYLEIWLGPELLR